MPSPIVQPVTGHALSLASLTAGALLLTGVIGTPAGAAQPEPGLGTAGSFAVLAGTTVTNTGPSLISGDLGVSPGTAVTGFPPGKVVDGVQNSANARAAGAEADMTEAWVDAAGRTPATDLASDIGGRTLHPGVYNHASGMFLTGTVTLDAKNDPAAVFIFQAGSTLITAAGSRVRLINGAQPCNVFWQVGSSATLGTDSAFVGTVMALTSVTARTRATVNGRLLAKNGQISLDTNVIRLPNCDETITPPVDDGSGDGSDANPTPTQTPGGGGAGNVLRDSGGTPAGPPPSGGGGGGGDSDGGHSGSGSGGSGSGGSGSSGDGSSGDGSGGSGSSGDGSGAEGPGLDNPRGPAVPPGHPRTGRDGTS